MDYAIQADRRSRMRNGDHEQSKPSWLRALVWLFTHSPEWD